MLNRLASYSDTEKKTVMICDDERDLLELFGLALNIKYNVILVDSGEDCIDKYIDEKNQGNKIHLLLLDYSSSSIVDLNDSGYTFDEIADYLDRVDK